MSPWRRWPCVLLPCVLVCDLCRVSGGRDLCRLLTPPPQMWPLQVVAAARRGFQASGLELNPWLVWFSRYRAWRAGLHHAASFYICDLWKVTLIF